MRKRLRKKKHFGEFQELGVEITITLKAESNFHPFLDDFLSHAVEAHGLTFGGGGSALRLEGILELGRCDKYAEKLAAVLAWLDVDNRVLAYKIGEPIDLWHVD